MNRFEQLRFARQTVVAQVAGAPGLFRALLGGRASGHGLQLRDPPDSGLGRLAREQASASLPPVLVQHSFRCWYLGDLFGQVDRVRVDPELLYVSCLLHDLGLADAHDPGTTDFATYGAALVRDLTRAGGASDAQAEVIAVAIDNHMDSTVSRDSPEAYLLHAAAHCDVVGRRAVDVPTDIAARLAALHPRSGFVDAFADAMRREARLRSGTRAAVLWRLGMSVPLHHNPLDGN